MPTSPSFYETDDIALAAVFVCRGFQEYFLEDGRHRVVFLFDFDVEMDGLAGAYRRGGLVEDPRTYSRVLNTLRREANAFRLRVNEEATKRGR